MHVALKRREETYKFGSQVGIFFGVGLCLFFIAVCGLSLVFAGWVLGVGFLSLQ